MKKYKIRTKILVGFSFVTLLTIFLGLTGVYGLKTADKQHAQMITQSSVVTASLADMREIFQKQRLALRAMLVDIQDPEALQNDIDMLRACERDMAEAMAVYETAAANADMQTRYQTFKEAYLGIFTATKEKFLVTLQSGDKDASMAVLAEGVEAAAQVSVVLREMAALVTDNAQADLTRQSRNASLLVAFQTAAMILAAILAMGLGAALSGNLSRPMIHMAQAFTQFGTEGNFIIDAENAKIARKNAERGDEIGACAKAALHLVEHMVDVQQTLSSVADGDLSVDVTILSERDSIGLSVAKVLTGLNHMFEGINGATHQVANGARMVSDGAQALAQGSTQQASATEQLSVSVSEVSEKTTESAQMATKAAGLAENIKRNAEIGNQQMEQMLVAVNAIQEAGKSIGKVIKVIDDIAFQTNILALNAAVEAARAGQYGKGFAVVAEEVRNLAAKSAEAARDTGSLIANSMEKSELGARIAGQTAESLHEIVLGIKESGRIIEDIAQASEQQAAAAAQINSGIDQVAKVVQQNSATAQESASAAEEMSQQTIALESLIKQFKLRKKRGDVNGAEKIRSMPARGSQAARRTAKGLPG